MNNPDLRREIFKFLRKKPRIKCIFCERILVWNKKKQVEYLTFKDTLGKYHTCIKCFDSKRYYLEWYEF